MDQIARDRIDGYFAGYPVFNQRRLEHLETLGLDLDNKRVLEIGAGIGQLTHFWIEHGCQVVSTEGQPCLVERFEELHPDWEIHCLDLGKPGSHDHLRKFLGKFDIVFCYGVLYHVPDPDLLLCDMYRMGDTFLLESMVWNEDNGKNNPQGHWPGSDQGPDYSCAYTPSRNWIMQRLSGLWPYRYVTRTQPRESRFPLKWPVPAGYIARAVFVASMQPLRQDTLLTELPMVQEYCVPE